MKRIRERRLFFSRKEKIITVLDNSNSNQDIKWKIIQHVLNVSALNKTKRIHFEKETMK